MNAPRRIALLAFALTTFLAGCASLTGPSWTTLIDGEKGMENFTQLGDANWAAKNGEIMADRGKSGFLISKASYKDFAMRAEFHAQTDTNSGIFIRLSDTKTITADNSYEVNIWDIRPDPKYGSGAIVNFAEVPVPLTNLVGGKWNVMEIEAKGNVVKVVLNGKPTVTMTNNKFASGPFALQMGVGVNQAQGGPIRWRKLQIREL